MTELPRNGNGFRVPSWLWGAIALASLGWAGATKLDAVNARVDANNTRIAVLEVREEMRDLRLCRMEVALHIPPAPLCNQASAP
jgi:hypothetical protein